MRLTVLGAVGLALADGTTIALRGVPALVAGYLAVHAPAGRIVRRDRVAFNLWPDRPEPSARRTLNDAVYRLRQLAAPAGVELLDATGDGLGLTDAVDTDLGDFERLGASTDPADWRSAIALYQDELLAGVDAEWADAARRTVADDHLRLLAAAWDERRYAGDRAAELEIARRWTAIAPFDDTAERALLRSLARGGELDEALRHFSSFASHLAAELGVEPARETVTLVGELRAEADFARRAAVVSDPRSIPFVGRLAERARLVTLVGRCVDGHGGLAVVLGDPGLGKTRLLDELAAAAGWRGASVSRAVGTSTDLLTASGPLIRALVGATPDVRREMLSDVVDPIWMPQLDALLAHGDLDDGVPIEVVPTLRQALAGLAAITPQLWLLDDAHWSGDEEWDALDALRADLERMRALVVVTARPRELRQRSRPWEIVQRWDAAGVPVVSLTPLDDAAITELVGGMRGPATTGQDVTSIVTASGGNPLVAVALCGIPDSGRPTGQVSTIAEVVSHQLAALAPAAADVLDAAAVLGDSFEYGLWSAVVGDADLVEHATSLERGGFLVAADRGFRFVNAAIRESVAARIPPGRQGELHRRALGALEARRPDDMVSLLAHAEGAGRAAAVSRYALEVAVQALRTSNFPLAVKHFRRSVETADDPARLRVALQGLVRALHVLAERDAEREALDRLAGASADLDGSQRAGVAGLVARWQIATGRFAEALETVAHASALLDSTPGRVHHPAPDGGRAPLALDAAAALRALGRMDEAHAEAERARAGFERVGDGYGAASALDLLGGIAWSRADFDVAAERHAAAAARFAEVGAPSARARALNNLGSAQWGRGDYAAAGRIHEEALALSRALGDRQSEGDNLDNLGGVAFMLGDHDLAVERYRAALSIRRDTGDPWGVSISLSNIGDAYRAVGDVERALACFAESIEENERAGVVRNETTTRQSQGLTLVDAGRPAEALPILEDAARRHAELGDHANRQETLVGVVKARLALGAVAAAAAVVAELLQRQRPADRNDLRQMVHLAAAVTFARTGDRVAADGHLALAARAMRETLQHLDEADRQRVLSAVPHHRETAAALGAASDRIVVPLAPTSEGRGVGAGPGGRVPVVWTVREPGDEPGAAGRRAVLLRLLDEARAQHAVPTDDDLARALGVSRRTVLRDVAALRAGDGPGATLRGRGGHRGGHRGGQV